ncbi:dienelactone hydrolase family protein [Longimicrobium sp.]|uniref:dienelactone hydrolase family protein n=1 Tax=Longimicrobium sp. TaxID=2029185 RepID=UPI002E336660|nr:dienelactone hydrolase family protein [Longimicrobium sp.]HEX6038491.1 dienelactone hydrolase family protein [Longimicrobium sp.]
MPPTELLIETADGRCPTHVFHPEGSGPWPGVIVYMDAMGIRPAMTYIAERIARDGYYVLLPDLFYRVEFDSSLGPKVFSDPAARQDLFTRVMPSASAANVMRDTEALLAHLAAEPRVRDAPIGVTGYCMGGRLALYAAGHFGERIAAAAAYHAGGVATDAPDSPHALAPRIRARVYVAGAIEDANFDDAQKARLEQALADAGVDHVVTTYDARHGFVPRDTPAHDDAAEARHWETLLGLYRQTLRP